MPVSCQGTTSVLTGADGMFAYKPAGTTVCLLDNTDFTVTGSKITLPVTHGFMPTDPVAFMEELGGNLDSGLTAGTTYYLGAVTETSAVILNAVGGTPVTLTGNGGLGAITGGVPSAIGNYTPALPTTGGGYGTGPFTAIATTTVSGSGKGLTVDVTVTTANVTAIVPGTVKGTGYKVGDVVKVLGTALGGTSPAKDITFVITAASAVTGGGNTPGGHVKVQFAEYEAVCQIAGFDINMTRDKIETTSLKCTVGGTAGKIVNFKTYQAGLADGTGTVRVQFTAATAGLGQRMLSDTLRSQQEGAWGKFFVNAVAGAGGSDLPDDTASSFIEVPLSLEGVSLAVDSGGTEATVATVNFSFAGPPTHMFTTAIG